MGLTRALGFAGALILSAIVGGTLIGSALAQAERTDATDAATPYCDTFMDTLASELGTTRDGLVAASKTAANAAIDAAVEASDLTDERAAEIRDRIDDADGTGCRWFGAGFAHGFGHGLARGLLGGDVLEAAADALGVDSADLVSELREADSLEAVAEQHGAAYDDLTASILSAVRADLDAGDIDPDRAEAVIERLTQWLDNGGQFDGFGRGAFGHRHPGG
jgi:hypothetical protein